MIHLRVELGSENRFLAGDVIRSILYRRCGRYFLCAHRQRGDTVAVRHPHLRVLLKALEQRVRMVDVLQVLPAVLTRTGALYLAAVGITDQLRTVADTQDRQSASDSAQVNPEGIVLIDAQRRTAQYHTDHVLVVLRVLVVRQNLAERVQFAYAAADQLRGLASEIQYDDFLHAAVGLFL